MDAIEDFENAGIFLLKGILDRYICPASALFLFGGLSFDQQTSIILQDGTLKRRKKNRFKIPKIEVLVIMSRH